MWAVSPGSPVPRGLQDIKGTSHPAHFLLHRADILQTQLSLATWELRVGHCTHDHGALHWAVGDRFSGHQVPLPPHPPAQEAAPLPAAHGPEHLQLSAGAGCRGPRRMSETRGRPGHVALLVCTGLMEALWRGDLL